MRALFALCCCVALGAQAEIFNAKVIVVMDGDTVMVLREGGSKAAGSPPAVSIPPNRRLDADCLPLVYPSRARRGSQKIKIRLANIDAPEKDQAFGKQSRDSLQELVGRKTVRIDSRAVDQYGRIIGLISVEGISVNQEQVKRGMAWAIPAWRNSHPTTPKFPEDKTSGNISADGSPRQPKTNNTYIGLQGEARQQRRGLWIQNKPQAPWQWRKLHPSISPVEPTRLSGASSPDATDTLPDMECGKKRRCSQMTSCEEARYYFARCGENALDGNHDGVPCKSLCGGE